jgi:signal transduction histidine kinase
MKEQEAEVSLRSKQLHEACERVQVATEQLREIAQTRLHLLQCVSHELRNALQAVGLGAMNLLQETNAQRRSESRIVMTRNAAHLQHILDRLQQFSNILAGETRLEAELLDLSEFLQALKKTHGQAAERKGLDLACFMTKDLPTVKTDAGKLRHIADILLSNAVEYTDHGSIEVTTSSKKNGRWIFRVGDTGMGIHESDAKQVFREFHRSQRSVRRGVGLPTAPRNDSPDLASIPARGSG